MALKNAYCTVIAGNYLAQALVLQQSVELHEPEIPLFVLIVDGEAPNTLETPKQTYFVTLKQVGFSVDEVDALAAIYDVVEFSTCVKPRFFLWLLEQYDSVAYLDPDTLVVARMPEIPVLTSEYGVVLTPHILDPIIPGTSFASEMNILKSGVYNLGFCAFGVRGKPFLEWWWAHLERECLDNSLLGLFVDQKWVDIGAVLFETYAIQDRGYNVAHWNLHERSIELEATGKYVVMPGKSTLKLMHFSGFNPREPLAITSRQADDLSHQNLLTDGFIALATEYAKQLLKYQHLLGQVEPYAYARNSLGRRISSRTRKVYRMHLLAADRGAPPSLFRPEERFQLRIWLLCSLGLRLASILLDASLSFKSAFPDTFKAIRKSQPMWVLGFRNKLFVKGTPRR